MLRGRGGEREHEGGRIKRGWMEGGGIVRGEMGNEESGEEEKGGGMRGVRMRDGVREQREAKRETREGTEAGERQKARY